MKCPCCHNGGLQLTQKPERHLYCPGCQHRLKTGVLPKNYYKKLSGRSVGMGKSVQRKNKERIAYLNPYIHKGMKVLEFGCAEGHLGSAIKKKWKVRYEAVEPSQDSRLARSRVDRVWKSLKAVPCRSRYHLILAFHVLEHIANPDVILRRLCRCLHPKGVLVTEVPHFTGNQRLPWDFHREHLHLFSASSLSCLLQRHGFQLKALGTGYYESDVYNDSLRTVAFKQKKIKGIEDDLRRRFEHFLDRQFVVYGIGGDCEALVLPYIKAGRVLALIDSLPSKWGRRINGKTVRSPGDIERYRYKKFLIATRRYQKEIRTLLKRKGVAGSRIISLGDILSSDG